MHQRRPFKWWIIYCTPIILRPWRKITAIAKNHVTRPKSRQKQRRALIRDYLTALINVTIIELQWPMYKNCFLQRLWTGLRWGRLRLSPDRPVAWGGIGVRVKGLGAAAPLTRVKPSFFGQKLFFRTEAEAENFLQKPGLFQRCITHLNL